MDKMLIFCGIWIAFLPNMKWNVLLREKRKDSFVLSGMFYLSGCFSVLVGLNAVIGIIHNTKISLLVLYVALWLLVVISIVIKIKVEKSTLARISGLVGVIFLILSMYVIFADIGEIASSCVALAGGLIMLAAPLDVIVIKNKSHN